MYEVGASIPQREGRFGGRGSYQACGSTVFGWWQQRCGLSLSVLQKLVITTDRIVRGAGSM